MIFFARFEASELGASKIGTEHLLLGIARESPALLKQLLGEPDAIRVVRRSVRAMVEPRAKVPTSTDMPFSNTSKEVLNVAAREADQLEQRSIETEHILAGLLGIKTGIAFKVLEELGLRLSTVRDELRDLPQDNEIPVGYFFTNFKSPIQPSDAFHQVLEYAMEEASKLSNARLGPEHLFLGLLRDEESKPAKILKEHGLEVGEVRKRLRDEGQG